MKKIALLLLIPALAMANDPNPPRPGSTRTQATSGSTSVAGASNAGNSQDITFNQGGAGRQVVESVPGVSMYTPGGTSPCYVVAGGSGSFLGGGFGINAPFLSQPCHIRETAKDMASVAVASYNLGNRDMAKDSAQNAQYLIECSDPNAYLIRKARNLPCPIVPDRQIISDNILGGMPTERVRINPNYHPQPVVQMMQNEPRSSYQPPNPNPALDRGFEREMRK
jgi:hypothetical protein